VEVDKGGGVRFGREAMPQQENTLEGREEMGRDGGRGWGVGDEGAAEVCVGCHLGRGGEGRGVGRG